MSILNILRFKSSPSARVWHERSDWDTRLWQMENKGRAELRVVCCNKRAQTGGQQDPAVKEARTGGWEPAAVETQAKTPCHLAVSANTQRWGGGWGWWWWRGRGWGQLLKTGRKKPDGSLAVSKKFIAQWPISVKECVHSIWLSSPFHQYSVQSKESSLRSWCQTGTFPGKCSRSSETWLNFLCILSGDSYIRITDHCSV